MYPEGQQILVIDSDAGRRQTSRCVLAAEGFGVTAVGEGFSALRVAAGRRFALAVVAADLPGMLDGAATLRHLRVRQPGLKILFTGAAAARSARPDGEWSDFIAAPFQRHELLGCVFELLQRDRGFRQPLRADRGLAG